jgi:alpha-L-rhamnosidase
MRVDRFHVRLIELLILVAALVCSAQAQNIADMQRGFEHPPDDTRIMMRWWWFGPAVAKPELEREMRVMKEGGIGGFEVQPVYPLSLDDPAKGIRNFPFLSDEYLDSLRFVSAKARELGMRMDLTLGSGWPFGGPQVSINDAAGMLRTERVKVDHNSRTVPIPNTGAGEQLLATFLVRPRGETIDPESIRELTEVRDGLVQLPALDGPGEVLFFISSRTGMMVKRPAIGGEGFVLDHLSRNATDLYLNKVGDRLLQAFGSTPPYAIFSDSLEVYNQDWTSDFLSEFKARRGYDLKPLLPALVADIGPQTEAVRYDWGRTITELLNKRFLAPVHAWSQRNRTLFRMQDYGIPAAAISSNAYVDLPEGEGSQWKIVRASRWASSASHLYGRPVTSSETWTWLHSPVFRATPLDMKAEADLHFLEGINQLIGHGWPYTPPAVDYPGWRFYAAAVFDEKNPWWIAMPDIAAYLQRVSFLLRQGQPANDVAFYLPNSDAYARFSPGHVHLIDTLRELVGDDVIPRVLEAGYNFDFFDDESLKQLGQVEKGQLGLGPNQYRVVILPGVERIPLETMKTLESFARNGGIVIATRRLPARVPGLHASQAEQTQLREITERLFTGASPLGHFAANENHDLSTMLNSLLPQDVALFPAASDVGFIHRHATQGEIYFLANTGNMPQTLQATFRVSGMQVERWDPLSGRVWPVTAATRSASGTTVTLSLAPYESAVLVFSNRTLPRTSNRSAAAVSAAVEPMDLSNGWQVTFGISGATNGEAHGDSITLDHLRSWTEDEGTRYFSGQATYLKTFSLPAASSQPGVSVRLDFGPGQPVPVQPIKAGMQTWFDAPVREAAVVYVNDQRAGAIWCAPYALDVTRFLRAGENRLRIVVGNLAINYMAGRRLPDYRLLNLRYGERFQAQDMDRIKIVPAGLLGPIRLVTTATADGH